MDFRLTEDQQMARETAREFAEKRLRPLAQKFDEEEAIGRELYTEAAELGFFGMTVPEEYGGLGLDPIGTACVMEELARASASFQVCLSVHNSLVCGAIKGFGSEAQKKKYLPRLAKGEMIGAYSLSEQGSGSDAGSLRASAARGEDSYVVNGSKAWVTNAGFADLFAVFLSTDKEKGSRGISCLLMERGLEGFSIGKKERKMGIRGSDTRELSFSDCEAPAEALLGVENEGYKIALSLLDGGRIGIAAQAVGIAQAAFDEAVAYAKQREQFGSPLADFQATRFKLADMALGVEAARLLTWRAAAALGGGRATREASMAKLFASQTANRVAYDAVQIHGGNGYIREFPVERYFRDARVTEIYEGTSEIQRLVISREILRAS
ncbi:MAG: acyl-CoA dehydrogenase family protein [Elusimicrobiota bacterium]